MEFAATLGVSRRTIIRWEQGACLPPAGMGRNQRRNRTRMRFFRLLDKLEQYEEAMHELGGDDADGGGDGRG